MNYQKAKEIIGHSGTFIVKTAGGLECKKRLFVSTEDKICEFVNRSRTRGYVISESYITSNWVSIEPYAPKKRVTNLVKKFKKYASNASFTSDFIRRVLNADETKDCYENNLTTGTAIDGEIISLDAIAKHNKWAVEEFRKALREKKDYSCRRFDFRGYDGSLELKVYNEDSKDGYYKKGDIMGWFSKEYRGCGNGYYYILIDDEHFIGHDVD